MLKGKLKGHALMYLNVNEDIQQLRIILNKISNGTAQSGKDTNDNIISELLQQIKSLIKDIRNNQKIGQHHEFSR